jgi:hypothetical protein
MPLYTISGYSYRRREKEIPELQGCVLAKVMEDKEPAFKENTIRSNKLLFSDELLVGLTLCGMVPIAYIGQSIKG